MIDGQPILNLSIYIADLALCVLGVLMTAIFGKTIRKKKSCRKPRIKGMNISSYKKEFDIEKSTRA